MSTVSFQNISESAADMSATEPLSKKEITFGQTVKDLILGFVKEHKGQIAGYAVLLFIGTLLSVVGITKISAALYKAVSGENKALSYKLLVAIIVISLVVTGVNFSIDRLEGKIAPSFQEYVKINLLTKVFDTNRKRYLDNILPIRYRAYVSATSQSTYYLFNSIIRTYTPNIILLLVLTGFLFYLDWKYGSIFVAGVTVCAGIFLLRQRKVVQLSTDAEKQKRYTDGFTFDVVSSLRTVVARDTVDKEMHTIKKQIQKSTRMHVTMNHRTDDLNYAINTSVAVVIFFIMAIAVGKIGTGETVVNILAALSLMGSLRVKLTGLSSTNVAAVSEFAKGKANQLPELDQTQQSTSDVLTNSSRKSICPPSISSPECKVSIEFRNVTFAYKDHENCIKNFSWKLEPAQINVLRARSGAGKTTLAKLLLRMYEPKEGSIVINGLPIREYSLRDIRLCTAFINQDQAMLNRSIYETLVYAVADAKRKYVEDLWLSVQRYFPEKTIDSAVGRDGCNLSTGQKQILRMLNAVLTLHARVLILDEPCSGLHKDLRKLVLDLIKEAAYTHGKTVWLITHDEETASIGDSVKNL